MNYEDQVRRSMEQAAANQQLQQCPVDTDVDAAFGPVSRGQESESPKYKGPAMKRPRAKKAMLKVPRVRKRSG